ncbi:MAG: T9SS type A sorting domain-containing protein [Flavobacteriaceae bacterium]
MKKITRYLIFLCSASALAQFTQVPDPVFEQYLIDAGIDTDGVINGQFLTSNAQGVIFIDIDNLPVTDLTGIEAFGQLERLDARNTDFVTADFSQNLQLDQLTIVNSPLSSINLTQNVNLITAFIDECNLSTIDVSQNVNLVQLSIDGNQLSSIDVAGLDALVSLSLEDNNFSAIDIPLPNLGGLFLNGNQLAQLDVSGLTSLATLYVHENQLSQLDVSNNLGLKFLNCADNSLTQMDVSNNTQLEYFACSRNNISNINLGTGLVDLESFSCSYNMLSGIDLGNVPKLKTFGAVYNDLNDVDFSACPLLERVAIQDNPIDTFLDFTQNPLLLSIGFENTLVSGIDVSQCPLLNYISFYNTQVIAVDLSNNPALDRVWAWDNGMLQTIDIRNGNNAILTLDGQNSPNLSCIYVDDASSGEGTFYIDPHTHLVNNEQECEALGLGDYLPSTFAIYPNPAKDLLSVEGSEAVVKVTLYDPWGRKLLEATRDFAQISVGHLPAGILLVEVATEKGTVVVKVVKE